MEIVRGRAIHDFPKAARVAAAEDDARFVVGGNVSAYLFCAMKYKSLPGRVRCPCSTGQSFETAVRVHEIKHDGYRIIVRRDGPTVRLYSRNGYNWTSRLSAIASAARRIKAKRFSIDGEAVVLGPDGLSLFEELSRREGHGPQSSMPST